MIIALVIIISALFLFHSLFNFYAMLYSWNDPHTLVRRRSPKNFASPRHTFSLIIPARHEDQVIGDTLQALMNLQYPKNFFEVLIVCRSDDILTIQAVQHKLGHLPKHNIRLLVGGNNLDNKPKALNLACSYSRGQVIAVFDAEDEPNPEILNIINTLLLHHHYDIVQSGVQLMSYLSSWFSAFNVLEYYFWFKSSLHLFTEFGVVPLGGNTVFIRREILKRLDGWDESMLTEDADLGIRASAIGAKIGVVYDELHVTREETPPDSASFIKQRTRWNQGFLQIFFQGKWLWIPGFHKKFFTGYLLLMPFVQAIWIIYFPLTLIAIFTIQMPVGWALFSLLPFYILCLQFVLYNYGIYEFTKSYKLRYSPLLFFKLLFSYFPYQCMLSFATTRAIIRVAFGQEGWEKTLHLNVHRQDA